MVAAETLCAQQCALPGASAATASGGLAAWTTSYDSAQLSPASAADQDGASLLAGVCRPLCSATATSAGAAAWVLQTSCLAVARWWGHLAHRPWLLPVSCSHTQTNSKVAGKLDPPGLHINTSEVHT